jgi:phage shock protein E
MKNLLLSLLVVGTVVVAVAVSTSSVRAAEGAPKAGAMEVKHVDAAQAKQLADAKKVVVIDVRTPDEFKAGSVPGAVNLDFKSADFAKRLGELDRSKTYLVHCASGNRSKQSLPVFEKAGFTTLYHLDGGFKAWADAGLPVAK